MNDTIKVRLVLRVERVRGELDERKKEVCPESHLDLFPVLLAANQRAREHYRATPGRLPVHRCRQGYPNISLSFDLLELETPTFHYEASGSSHISPN